MDSYRTDIDKAQRNLIVPSTSLQNVIPSSKPTLIAQLTPYSSNINQNTPPMPIKSTHPSISSNQAFPSSSYPNHANPPNSRTLALIL